MCECGRVFVTYLGLTYHIKKRHPEYNIRPKSNRGRKPLQRGYDYESTKYLNFFQAAKRRIIPGEKIDITSLVENVFNFIFKGNYTNKLFSHPESYNEHYVLNKLVNNFIFDPTKDNIRITCDEIFYEYLFKYKDKTNQKYFTLLLKFIVLIKECYDIHKNKLIPFQKWQQFTNKNAPQDIPEICNEFYGEFLSQNNFFGIEEENDRLEIIEIIQHFCMWLYKNHYTKSKLSLASNVNL